MQWHHHMQEGGMYAYIKKFVKKWMARAPPPVPTSMFHPAMSGVFVFELV